jgi:hypothetical protein
MSASIHRTSCRGLTRSLNGCNVLMGPVMFVVDRTVVKPDITLCDLRSRDQTLWRGSCSCSLVGAVGSWIRSSVWVVQLVLWGRFGDRTSGVRDLIYTFVD